MNDLGNGILKVMENSSLGRMGRFVLNKQTSELGIDLEHITQEDVPVLASRLKVVLPFFLADETDEVVRNIKKLANNGNNMVIS